MPTPPRIEASLNSPALHASDAQGVPATLVLGSGGARGLAHIGVIQALERDGRYRLQAVTGSSIGALVGGLYAAGKLQAYTDWVRELKGGDVWSLLDFSFTRRGLFTGERLMKRLKDMLGDALIEDLPIPFTAVACDLHRRQEVWLDRGSLFEAIRASIAIPGLFTPVERDGRVLVDGGLLSPVPVVPALQHGAPWTIAVSLNGSAGQPWASRPGQGRGTWSATSEAEKAGADAQVQAQAQADADADARREPARANAMQEFLDWAGRRMGWVADGKPAPAPDKKTALARAPDDGFDVISRSVDAMQDRIARHQLAGCRPDLLIEVPVDACGMLEFHRANEMIQLGRRQARLALRALDGHDADEREHRDDALGITTNASRQPANGGVSNGIDAHRGANAGQPDSRPDTALPNGDPSELQSHTAKPRSSARP